MAFGLKTAFAAIKMAAFTVIPRRFLNSQAVGIGMVCDNSVVFLLSVSCSFGFRARPVGLVVLIPSFSQVFLVLPDHLRNLFLNAGVVHPSAVKTGFLWTFRGQG